MDAVVDASTWPVPPVFAWLAGAGNVTPDEMLRVFNCGIGMVLVVAADQAEAALAQLRAAGEQAQRIGRLEAGAGAAGLRVENLPATWPR